MKETFVEMLRGGQSVDEVFVVEDKRLSRKKNGDPFLTCRLVDRTGEVKGVVWDDVEAVGKKLVDGKHARIVGSVGTYDGALQIVVRQVSPAHEADLHSSDFLPTTDRDVEKMFERLMELAGTIQNEHLVRLLTSFFEDREFVTLFKTAPAAKKMHHAYLGGLLEHTLSIAALIQAVSAHYKGIDRDLLLTGGILHDIGKIHELTYQSHIDYSDAGRLLSHIVVGTEMLEKKIRDVPGFPEELALLLKHMVVSHHGTREFGSPQPPMTLEAVILYYLDDLDAKVTGIRAFMEREGLDGAWTSYHRLMERFFYKGKEKETACS